jgi:TrkA domain protein
VGARFEFELARGERIAVVAHRSGRVELALYNRGDPDACRTVLELDPEDAATLADILGAPRLTEAAAAMQQIEGLAIDWLAVEAGSAAAGATIAEGEYRTKTGASIVAVIRETNSFPAPDPGFSLSAGDVAVAVGTSEGLMQLRALLAR